MGDESELQRRAAVARILAERGDSLVVDRPWFANL